MKTKTFHFFVVAAALIFGPALSGTPSSDEAIQKTLTDYRERVTRAAEELNRTHARIADEKSPLLEQIRAAEDRTIMAESETKRLDANHEDATEQRRKLLQDLDSIRKTIAYANTLSHDALKAVVDGFAPGEGQFAGAEVQALQKQLEDPTTSPSGNVAMDVADFLLARTEHALGGYRAAGSATLAETNQVLKGTFAFVGPEVYFQPSQGGGAGTVRPRDGAKYPTSYALPMWKMDDSAAFFAGKPGTIIADASGGKALRLKETSGTVWAHVKKGGIVAFAILLVGILSAVMITQKLRDLSRMAVDSPTTVAAFLALVANGSTSEAEKTAQTLRRTTRELFTVGLRNANQSKVILEEQLLAVLLEQRLYYERRLPLLAVIATAAPLMGLLGTVVGMVKTFALITVFGTGNAGKLSTGISEVLLATELGLVVAIPTLVAHGFLAHRIQKNLSLLERYALQFATAVEAAKTGLRAAPTKGSVAA